MQSMHKDAGVVVNACVVIVGAVLHVWAIAALEPIVPVALVTVAVAICLE